MPRPPETTTRAPVSSGRSDLVSSCPVTSRLAGVGRRRDGLDPAPLPPVAAAASKAVVRTVITLIASFDCTVAKTLPA